MQMSLGMEALYRQFLIPIPSKALRSCLPWVVLYPAMLILPLLLLQDLARLSRWMAGKAVGLVLSGGGSRGLAHLGVLHALDDAGVPVDVIGGTSQARARLMEHYPYNPHSSP